MQSMLMINQLMKLDINELRILPTTLLIKNLKVYEVRPNYEWIE